MEVLNRHHYHGKGLPDGAVYVGRGTALGNPFEVGPELTRDEAVDQFHDYLIDCIEAGDPVILTAMRGLTEQSKLACSCVPKRCHATEVAEIWAQYALRWREEDASRPVRRIYTGVGSRDVPDRVAELAYRLGRRLAELGFTMRSGGANGMDTVFEEATPESQREIFLPFPGFKGRKRALLEHPTAEAIRIAYEVHPAGRRLGQKALPFHARNTHQVLGKLLDDPSDFVLCYTPDGARCEAERTRRTGGTGQAIALASRWGVPVFNLYHPGEVECLGEFIRQRYGVTRNG